MKADIIELKAVIDNILFGIEDGDDVISVEHNESKINQGNEYKITSKSDKQKGLIEQLRIGIGHNLGINTIIAKKLRDGIVDGLENYFKAKDKVVEKIKTVKDEESVKKTESHKEDLVIENLAKDLDKPVKVKVEPKKEITATKKK